MEIITKKWIPVLSKCKEIPAEQQDGFAQILENQYGSLPKEERDQDSTEKRHVTPLSVQMFSRVVLPVVRKMWTYLFEAGIDIVPIESPEMAVGIREDRIDPTPVDYFEAERGFDLGEYARRLFEESGEPINGIDRDAAVSGRIAKECAEKIVALFNGEKVIYHPYLLLKYDGEALTAVHTWTPLDE